MSTNAIGLTVLSCVFGGALFGMLLRRILPESHLSHDSKDIVKVAAGLIGTMAALVLGLLTASAKGSYDTQKNELTEISAKVVLLDRLLAHYGPETGQARDLLKLSVTRTLDRIWSKEPSQASNREPVGSGSEGLFDLIQALSPKDDTQHSIKDQALNLAMNLGQTRWLMFEQGTSSISTPLLVIVVFWLAITFLSFGLFSPPNLTVGIALFVCSLSVASAIFLILEMDRPYEGLIRLSPAPLQSALAHLGE